MATCKFSSGIYYADRGVFLVGVDWQKWKLGQVVRVWKEEELNPNRLMIFLLRS